MPIDRCSLSTAACLALATALLLLAPPALAQAPAARVPTIDELVELGSVGAATISPDGRWVAYEESTTDWERDAFVSQLWVADTSTGRLAQLTRGQESAGDIEWSPDSRWITFLRSVDGKNQVHAIRPDGGEALVLSRHDAPVANHEWTPDGRSVVFAAAEGEDAAGKARKDALGDFTVVRRDYRYAQLWTLPVAEAMRSPAKARQRTRGSERHVGAFEVAPDGRRVAFHASRTPDLVDGGTTDIYLLDLGAAMRSPRWSPSRAPTSIRAGHPTAPAWPSSRRWANRASSTPTAASRSCRPRRAHPFRLPTASTNTRSWWAGHRPVSTSLPCRRRPRTCSASTPRHVS